MLVRDHGVEYSMRLDVFKAKQAAEKNIKETNRKLTPEERQRRKEKGLCMFCGAKGHLAKDCRKAAASASAKGRSAQAAASSSEESSKA